MIQRYSWGLRFADIQETCLTPDMGECLYEHREHALIYVRQGQMDVTASGRTTHLEAGECVFVRRDYRVTILKRCTQDESFLSTTLVFKHDFLVDMFHRIDRKEIPYDARRPEYDILKIPVRPDIKSLFDSILPYVDSGIEPSEEWIHSRMAEGLQAVLATDAGFYASLFDFVGPWKIDILEFMNRHYQDQMSLAEMARYTGRSLAQFKRDFARLSDLPPQKWVIEKRLETAHELLSGGDRKVSDVMIAVGFCNLSHFSKIYKEKYGVSPSTRL